MKGFLERILQNFIKKILRTSYTCSKKHLSYLPSEPVSRLTDFWSLSNSTVISVKIFSIATNQTLPSYCNSLYHQSSAKNKCIDSFFPGWTWTPSCFSHFLRISALPILDQEIRTLFFPLYQSCGY